MQFIAEIEWKFDNFQHKIVKVNEKKERGLEFTEKEHLEQTHKAKDIIIKKYGNIAEPFSLIDPIHNLMIIDSKWIIKQDPKKEENVENKKKNQYQIQNDSDLKEDDIVVEPPNQLPQDQKSIFDSIDSFHAYLEESWNQCDKYIKTLEDSKNENKENKLKLKAFLKDKKKYKIYLLDQNFFRKNPNATKQRFFAINYQYQRPLNDQDHDKQHSFMVFNDSNIFEIQLQLKFKVETIETTDAKENDNIIKEKDLINYLGGKEKDKNSEKQQTIKLLKCYAKIYDPQKFFYTALENIENPFKNISFDAHGDYVEYPFRETLMRRRKLIKEKSYSLVFQGGGAKGVAYVGSYQAIKEMKNKKNKKDIPITSIMGSSAGGIIALAISTGIEPYEVQKICYKMRNIPKKDRIDQASIQNSEKIDQRDQNHLKQIQNENYVSVPYRKTEMIKKIKRLLHQYGLIEQQTIDKFFEYLSKQSSQNLYKKIIDLINAWSESIGQILVGQNYKMNLVGLLLEGALMKGQAIYDIGAQCLVKYVLSKRYDFVDMKYENVLGASLSNDLSAFVNNSHSFSKRVMKITLNSINIKYENSIRVIFSIINKFLLIADRNFKKYCNKKLILNKQFADWISENFEFKSIYEPQLPLIPPQLQTIIFNHYKLHPNSNVMENTDLSQGERRKTITQILENTGQISHENISQILAEEFLLNPENYTFKQKESSPTFKQFFQSLINDKIGGEHANILKRSKFFREIAEIIAETITELGVEKIHQKTNDDANQEEKMKKVNAEIEKVREYNQHFEKFKEVVQKITLKQYYNITNIELSCTSVDLDSKILRFFNQKTTPDLPVCRAVQMTGSFPVGFKAQRWRQEWGNYRIHYSGHRREFFLDDHEFTDGGMLANFPIKYYDNDHIRDVYFSHVINKIIDHPYQTIMLGFGLDKLTTEQYTPNQNEASMIKIKNHKIKDALDALTQDLSNYLPSIKSFFSEKFRKFIDTFRYPKSDEIKWRELNFNLQQEIPLLRFGFKLIRAYPRADRNLNIECFKDEIYRTKIVSDDKTASELNDQAKSRILTFVRGEGDIFHSQAWYKWRPSFLKSKPTYQETNEVSEYLKGLLQQNNYFEFKLQALQKATNFLIEKEYAKQNEQKKNIDWRKISKNKKQNIKWLLIKIIKNLMKLKLDDDTIQQQTKNFYFLKMNKQIDGNIIDQFLLTEHQEYLVQYIFLSKMKNEDLVRAKNQLKKVGYLTLYKYWEQKSKEEEGLYWTYLTIKDIKFFFRRIFSKDRSIKPACNYNSQTLLAEQDLNAYQYQDLLDFKVQQDDHFQSDYKQSLRENRKVNVSIIHAEHLLIKKSFINKISWISALKQVFAKKVIKNVQGYLEDLIKKNPQKYSPSLTQTLFDKKEKILKGQVLIKILENQSTRKDLLRLLFNKELFFYDENQFIKESYQKYYSKIKQSKEQQLRKINSEINGWIHERDQKKYKKSIPTKLQIQYLSDLLEEISIKLLLKMTTKENENLKQEIQKQADAIKKDVLQNQQNLNMTNINNIWQYRSDFNRLTIFVLTIRYELYKICQQRSSGLTEKYKQIKEAADNIGIAFAEIRWHLIRKVKNTVKLPIKSIGQDQINDIFTLQSSSLKKLCQSLFKTVKTFEEAILKKGSTSRQGLRYPQDFMKYYNNFFKFHRPKLPAFEIVWQIYLNQYKNGHYSRMLKKCFSNQLNHEFISKWEKYHKIEGKSQQQGKKQDSSLETPTTEQQIKVLESKKKLDQQNQKPELKVHLILEGAGLSNNYYAYYYELFQDIKDTLIPNNMKLPLMRPTVRAVTTSSYHSIFGFLLALGSSPSDLKSDLMKIRNISLHFEPKQQVENYFNSYKWAYNNLSDQREHWQFVRTQNNKIFLKIEELGHKDLEKFELSRQFEEVRKIYEHENEKIIRYYDRMMSEITSEMEFISQKTPPKLQTRDISKKYGFNYFCDLERWHEYKHINQRSLKIYRFIIEKMFDSFGSLLEGIVTNFCTSEVRIKLPSDQRASDIYKGFVIKQLLTGFRIKDFVIQKLEQASLRENITLKEFFEQAPKKILLSFTTINVQKERLQFMNKNTLPNMPVWAAIVSASCVPYFYHDFECPREWEYPVSGQNSYYEYIVNEYFKCNILDYQKAKYLSGNIISSLPMELLTNETILSKMFAFDPDQKDEPYLHIGFAFDSHQEDYENGSHVLKRNYLKVGLFDAVKTKYSLPDEIKTNHNCQKQRSDHRNKEYTSLSKWKDKLATIFDRSQFKKIFSILIDSNDNFTLHSYWDRLVRLPIKIGTLDFHEIINTDMKKMYGADVPSDKTKDTIERSYEITKYFERKHFGTQENRYTINIRVQIITIKREHHDEEVFAKIEVLSHSKWNRNRYNNFIVSYAPDLNYFDANAVIAIDSEILCSLSKFSSVYLRFYFPNYEIKKDDLHSSILFSQIELNLDNIRKEMPLMNSYDYSFNFKRLVPKVPKASQTEGASQIQYQDLPAAKKNKIEVIAEEENQIEAKVEEKNKIEVSVEENRKIEVSAEKKNPKLKIRCWNLSNRINAKDFYIHPYNLEQQKLVQTKQQYKQQKEHEQRGQEQR